ncbi:DgyrCDS6898 [Dimorphilus gyrociliatus]|uniref:DgyrCDS6898 n=1 Tax=Dimorphilus gyrociliatus TaxID=2664684 RepID=A0A7I8VS23_9ANNE|nr:DgyrCDS6898 [Dimorphilus gyrociliatus]
MDVIEIVPLDDYIGNIKEAKLCASVKWLISKAFPDGKIPSDLQEPFESDQNGSQRMKQTVVKQLVSSNLYCRTCAHIFGNSLQEYEGRGHSSVFQMLSRKGFYVVAPNESNVTEQVLSQPAPFKVGAHIAMMDSLMMAYASQTSPVEKVITAVKRFATVKASSELPFDVEDGLIFWMNKIAGVIRNRLNVEDENFLILQQLGDMTDGCNLAAILAHYQTSFKLQDAIFRRSLDIADSLYNLEQILSWCDKNIETIPLNLNDLFYCEPIMRPNIIAFIAELFNYFEGDRNQQVRKRPASANFVKPPISEATKKSFRQNYVGGDGNRTESPVEIHNAAEKRMLGKKFLQKFPWSKQSPLLPLRKTSQDIPKQAWPQEGNSLLDQVDISNDYDLESPEPLIPARKKEVKETRSVTKSSERGEEKKRRVPKNLPLKPEESSDSSPGSEEYKTPIVENAPLSFNNASTDEIVHENLFQESPLDRMRTDRASFVLHNKVKSPEEASAAGIPVVEEDKASPVTSFAKIAASGPETPSVGIIGSSAKRKKKKTTTFSLPNQTTWSQCAQKNKEGNSVNSSTVSDFDNDKNSGLAAEIHNIRMRLDQRRKLIEKERKREREERSEIRQHVGDTAFKQVVGVKKGGESAPASLIGSFNSSTGKEIPPRSSSTHDRLDSVADDKQPTDNGSAIEFSRRDSLLEDFVADKTRDNKGKGISPTIPNTQSNGLPNLEENTNDTGKSFSHVNTQKTISDAKQRWSTDTTSENFVIQTNSSEKTEQKQPKAYGASLDKLNTSIKELHGEIMKLSLDNSTKPSPGSAKQLPFGSLSEKGQHCSVPGQIFLPDVTSSQSPKSQSEEVKEKEPELPKKISIETKHEPHTTVEEALEHIQTKEESNESQPTGFYVDFGSESTPKSKRKPKLTSTKEKKENKENNNPNNESPITSPRQQKEEEQDEKEAAKEEATSAVGFMVADNDSPNDRDLEKRKQQRMEAIQKKRRAEQEEKRKKMEEERAQKAFETRMKQEEQEAKRERDRLRREERLQTYLRKKQQTEEGIESPPKPKKTVRPRPKSQAFVGDHDLASRRMASRSHENLVKVSPSTGRTGEGHGDEAAVNRDAYDYSNIGDDIRKVSFGRRPPSPLCLLRTKRTSSISSKSDVEKLRTSRSGPMKAIARPDSLPGSPRDVEKFILPSKNSNLVHKRHNSMASVNPIAIRAGHHTTQVVKPPISSARLEQISATHGRSNTEIVEPNDYTGPKLFVKPSAKSNRSIIMNAISHCCLAGDVNSDKKQKVLEAIGRSTANHFIILFRGVGQQYRALYSYFPETEDIIKVSGIGPSPLTNKMMDGFYKYNSGGKSFTRIETTKHISVSIDAVTIQNCYWQKRQSSTSSATRKHQLF